MLTTKDMENSYRRMRRLFFGSKVPRTSKVKFEISKRLTVVAAYAYHWCSLIKFSYWYFEKYPDELDRTMAHEMIHFCVREKPIHGKGYAKEEKRINKLAVKKLGIENFCAKYSLGRAREYKREYLYECSKCGYRRIVRTHSKLVKNLRCRECWKVAGKVDTYMVYKGEF